MRVAGKVTVELDGQPIASLNGDGDMAEQRIPMANFQGRSVPIHVHYQHEDGDAVVQCGWHQNISDTTTTKAQERSVYLPTGGWRNFWTGSPVEGGQTLTTEAPLERMPVFVRDGSIVPMGPIQQWADERPEAPWEIRIYPGKNATYTIYEDAGNSYAYESGACSRIRLSWDDTNRRLTLHERDGQFPEMVSQRDFHVTVVSPGKGCGVAFEAKPAAICRYAGDEVSLSIP